jgi:hypothetical protein
VLLVEFVPVRKLLGQPSFRIDSHSTTKCIKWLAEGSLKLLANLVRV